MSGREGLLYHVTNPIHGAFDVNYSPLPIQTDACVYVITFHRPVAKTLAASFNLLWQYVVADPGLPEGGDTHRLEDLLLYKSYDKNWMKWEIWVLSWGGGRSLDPSWLRIPDVLVMTFRWKLYSYERYMSSYADSPTTNCLCIKSHTRTSKRSYAELEALSTRVISLTA